MTAITPILTAVSLCFMTA